ncbi:MAG: hypothetical protein WCJ29_06390 [bacterium]
MKILQRLSVVVALALPFVAMAQMSSTNFKVTSDTVAAAGGFGSSTNFKASDTLAESATPTEEGLTSTNYRACAGFQCVPGTDAISAVLTTSTGACTSSSTIVSPLTQHLGSLTTDTVSTAPERICVIVSASGTGGVSVSIQSANGGLKSTSTPTDELASSAASLVSGTTGYGACASNVLNGFSKGSGFDGSCNTSTGHAVGALTTNPTTIFSATGDVTDAVGEILTKAAIDSAVPVHEDYGDMLTIIITGSF